MVVQLLLLIRLFFNHLLFICLLFSCLLLLFVYILFLVRLLLCIIASMKQKPRRGRPQSLYIQMAVALSIAVMMCLSAIMSSVLRVKSGRHSGTA
jgi:hypothetical protein